MSMLTLERILNFLIMVYLTSVYFSRFNYQTKSIHSNAFDTGVPRSNCNLVMKVFPFRRSSIHSHNQENKDLTEQFTILKKCRGKFECLIYEMPFIQEKKPKLNTQSDSIKAKLFST